MISAISRVGFSSGYGLAYGYVSGEMQRMQMVRPVQERQGASGSAAVSAPGAQEETAPVISEAARSGMAEAEAFKKVGSSEMPDLFIRKGADPAEYAVKMRMEYADGSEGKSIDSVQESAKEGECQTCAQRKYQDGSDDMGVSFQTPTRLSPEEAGAAVRGHEQEHVTREQAKAKREGKEVVSQSVVIHTSVCPECGKVYVSGGTTRTTTATKPEEPNIGGEGQERRSFSAVA